MGTDEPSRVPGSQAGPGWRGSSWLVAMVLAAVTLAIYWPAMRY